MPWLENDPMNERLKFVQDALSDRFTMAEVCARYGGSRKTGYTWIARYAEEGRRGRDRKFNQGKLSLGRAPVPGERRRVGVGVLSAGLAHRVGRSDGHASG